MLLDFLAWSSEILLLAIAIQTPIVLSYYDYKMQCSTIKSKHEAFFSGEIVFRVQFISINRHRTRNHD